MPVQIAIFEDHQGIIDGYLYRLNPNPDMQIVGTALFGADLEPMLARQPVDILLLDVHLPTSPENRAPFQALQAIPRLLKKYPNLRILVISMSTQITLIQALLDAGISGYIFKDDQVSIQKLSTIVEIIANGGMYFSPEAHRQLLHQKISPAIPSLTHRQLEVLSLCAASPDITTAQIASQLQIANSTVRNLLTKAYLRLGVRTRAAALARVQQLGLITGASAKE
jgi:two-component system nitrate/nitrite response regulator NarL